MHKLFFEDRCEGAWADVLATVPFHLTAPEEISEEYQLPIDYVLAMFKIKARFQQSEFITKFSWKEIERMYVTIRVTVL